MNGQPYPNLQIESGSEPNGLSVRSLLLALRNLPRKIILAEDERSPDRAFVYSLCLQPGDAAEIVSAIREVARNVTEGQLTVQPIIAPDETQENRV